MTIYYSAREAFGKDLDDAGLDWDGYTRWQNLSHLTEVVTLDGSLNSNLADFDQQNVADWKHVFQSEGRMAYFYNDLDYLLTKIKQKERFNLLAFVIGPETDLSDMLIENFEFVGYDLIDDWYSVSTLTNCDGFGSHYDRSDLNQYGLLISWEKACYVQKMLLENFAEQAHAQTYVTPIWRHKTIGRVSGA